MLQPGPGQTQQLETQQLAGAFPRVGLFINLAVQGSHSQLTHGDGTRDGSNGDSVVRARRACARPAAVAGGDREREWIGQAGATSPPPAGRRGVCLDRCAYIPSLFRYSNPAGAFTGGGKAREHERRRRAVMLMLPPSQIAMAPSSCTTFLLVPARASGPHEYARNPKAISHVC